MKPVPLSSNQQQSSASQQILNRQSKIAVMSTNSRSGTNRPSVIEPSKICGYTLKQEIGYGSFSTVKLAVHVETGKSYACKIIPKRRLLKTNLEERFETEVRILERFDHPGIVRLYNLFKDSLNFYLIFELCPFGTLFNYISENGKLPEAKARFIFKQIVSSLKYIHEQGIAHRDIKPENILIDPDTLTIKFIDFGLSSHFESGFLMTTICGSPSYTSPECIAGKPYDGFKSDTWSLGVVLYCIVCGVLPWTKKILSQLLNEIKHCNFFVPMNLDPNLRDLIIRLMDPVPENRINLEDVLKHPWLDGVPDVPVRPKEDDEQVEVDLSKVDEFFSKNESQPFLNDAAPIREAKTLLIRTRRDYKRNICVPKVKKQTTVDLLL